MFFFYLKKRSLKFEKFAKNTTKATEMN